MDSRDNRVQSSLSVPPFAPCHIGGKLYDARKRKNRQEIQLYTGKGISNEKQRNEISLRGFHATIFTISIARLSSDYYWDKNHCFDFPQTPQEFGHAQADFARVRLSDMKLLVLNTKFPRNCGANISADRAAQRWHSQ